MRPRQIVLHLATYLQGGAGRAITDLALDQRRAGYRVIVVASRKPEPGFENYPAYIERLEADGVEVDLVDSLFKRDTGLNAAAATHALWLLAGVAPSVIHAHAAVPARIGLAVRERFGAEPVCPVVHTMHGWSRRKLPAYVREDLSIMHDVDLVVFPSAASAAELERAGGRFETTCIVPYGIDAVAPALPLPDFLAPVAARRAAGARVLVTIGSLTAQKNQAALVEALPAIAAHHDVIAVLVGEGPEAARLNARALALGVADRVVLTGYLPDATAALRIADLLVQPSRAESFGISVIEAFRARVPVVANDIPALADLVRPGQTGWRFDAERPGSLSAVVRQALDATPAHRDAMVERAAHAFHASFTLDRMVARYREAYEVARQTIAKEGLGDRALCRYPAPPQIDHQITR